MVWEENENLFILLTTSYTSDTALSQHCQVGHIRNMKWNMKSIGNEIWNMKSIGNVGNEIWMWNMKWDTYEMKFWNINGTKEMKCENWFHICEIWNKMWNIKWNTWDMYMKRQHEITWKNPDEDLWYLHLLPWHPRYIDSKAYLPQFTNYIWSFDQRVKKWASRR